MQDDPSASVTCFFQQLCEGSPDAAERLWERFSPRLLGLARKTLSGRGLPGADPQDVAQSAFICFWRQASDGRFAQTLDRDDLWKLLGVITVRKARKKIRHALAQKRGAGQELNETGVSSSEAHLSFRLDDQWTELPAVEFDLICAEFLEQLEDESRSIVLLKLMRHTNREVATMLGCTERKVERKLQLVRRKWQELEGEEPLS